MIAPLKKARSRRPVPNWHRPFLAMLPAIIAHAKIAFRYLRPEARGEAVQEVVCNALKAFARLVQLKKVDLAYPSVLARFGVKQVKDHRKVGGHLNINDVMSRYCQVNKGVTIARIDQYDETQDEWTQLVVEDKNAGPAEIVRVRMDFSDWLASLPCRHRRLAQYLSLGNRTSQAARKFRVSEGRVSQLRKELAESWRKFVGDEPGPAALAV